ncbi:glutamate racemase [Buchnera aphidicola]|uniref:glutamate racemase n=1 Tax=Buchnera aphidicola TaxID=9 RepID=UPI0009E3B284|nr:glutamate racemase [Buchnera aphidicola]
MNLYKTNKINIACNILILDSGLGGLSIYKKIKNNFKNANFIYVCDNAAFPYGTKKESFIISRCLKIISTIATRENITLAILACNTASVTSLLILRNKFNFPIIGIIPNIKKAIKTTKNKTIGLLATRTTIYNKNIQNLIKFYAPRIIIKTLHNEKLIKITEEELKKKTNSMKLIKKTLNSWITSIEAPDTIILGCTHFYFIKHKIKKLFLNKINIIDSNVLISKKLHKILNNNFVKNENIAYLSRTSKKDKDLLNVFKKYDFIKFKKIELY